MTSNQTEKNAFVAELINERLMKSDRLLDNNIKAKVISKAESALIREFLANRVQFKKISANRARIITTLICSARKYKLCPDVTGLETDDIATLFLAMESDKCPFAKNTVCTVDMIFRMFAGFLKDEKGFNIDMKKIMAISKPDAQMDGIKPSDILTEAQLDVLIKFAHNARDKAIMALFADCGVRPEEIELLKWQDLEFTPENVRVNVTDGKDQSKRKMNYVIARKQYLRDWKAMNEGDEKDMPVFRAFVNSNTLKLGTEAIKSASVSELVALLFNESKTPYPAGYCCRLLRTSNITNQLKAGLDQVAIMKSHWSSGLNSRMWKHYERLADTGTENMFMKNAGHKIVDLRKKDEREEFICECGQHNAPGRTECSRCHTKLKLPSTASDERMQAMEKELNEMKAFMAAYMKNNSKN